MNAAERFVSGCGAIPIAQVAVFFSRDRSWIYRAIGRGQLRKAGPGRVTADSVLELYASFEEGGDADEVKHSTSTRSVPVADLLGKKVDSGSAAVTGGGSVEGGAK